MAKKVLRSTWSVFKKIMTNPLTIALLIGGIFLLFRKPILNWLSKFVGGIRENIVPVIKSVATTAMDFLSKCWTVIKVVGVALFKTIDAITNPKGIVVRFIVGVVKTFLAIKKGISELVKKSGKSSIDTFCMFLAGDYIGLAINAIKGFTVKVWEYLKNTKLIRWITGFLKSVAAIGKIVTSYSTAAIRSIGGGLLKLAKLDFKGAAKAAAGPWVDLYKQVKDLITGKTFGDSFNGMDNYTMTSNPEESNSGTAKNAAIAVRSLGMKGDVEKSLAHWNKYQSMFTKNVAGDLGKKMQ